MTITKHTLTLEILEQWLARAGLQTGEQVQIRIGPQHIEITRNPTELLWGTLHSTKSVAQLQIEASEEMGDYLDAKLSG